MKKLVNFTLIILGIAGLISVRIFEDTLFYDPFLQYFDLVSKTAPLPDFVWGKLILHHFFRFFLNFSLSLLIIYCIFKRKDWTIQAGVMLLLVFLVALPAYLFCIEHSFSFGYLLSFYLRRLVIQPIILLFIIPLFYYRKHIENVRN